MSPESAADLAFLDNSLYPVLRDLGLSTPESVHAYFPRVRDRDDISVYQCGKCEALFLSRVDHISVDDYMNRSDLGYWSAEDRSQALATTIDDDQRRANQFGPELAGKRWVDVGTGAGGLLDYLRDTAAQVTAVEPQTGARLMLENEGYMVYPDVAELPEDHFDVATLFHVFEHFDDPIGILRTIANKLVAGGTLIVEVPHARDALLALYDCEAFKAHTFWSEHLILHTSQSLSRFLSAAGFSVTSVSPFQRYPLANHLHWLAKGKGGGQSSWPCMRSREAEQAYAQLLANAGMTDTLIAMARKAPSAH